MTTLAPFDAPGTFYKGNLHTHSTNSDGALAPDIVCKRYAAEGYDFICLSDHLVGLYDYPISDTTTCRGAGFTTILGAEVHSGALSNGEIWHLLAVGLPTDFAPPDAPDFDAAKAPEPAASLARRCRDAGAFVAIAHPEWFNMTLDDARQIDAAHAVEIYNHGCEIETDRGNGTAILDQLLQENRRMTAIATDDAHFKGPDHFGGWVMVKAAANEPDLLLSALKAGHHYSSQGPLIHHMAYDGERVTISCSPAETVIALGAGAAGRQVYGRGLSHAEFDVTRFRQGGWLRLVVVDQFGRKAWSNPVWLD
ncbi:MAG: PHP domain-containing protein [Pseudomonadota bacterium]